MQATVRTQRETSSPESGADSQILRPHKQQYPTSSTLSSGSELHYTLTPVAHPEGGGGQPKQFNAITPRNDFVWETNIKAKNCYYIDMMRPTAHF